MITPDPRVIRPLERLDATDALICLAFCGGGTGGYRQWAAHVDPGTDLVLICYPGREGRFAEDFARDWEELAVDTTAAVRAAADRPFTLFGHSMGGWMAFDVATRLERTGGPVPDRLVVSSCNAAYRGVTDRDRFPRQSDSDPALLDWMRITGSLPDYVLGDPDLREMAVELMRADVVVRDSYQPQVGRRTAVPLHVLYGADDPVIEPAIADQWARLATAIRVDELPGGHFYTPQVWGQLPRHFAPSPAR
jgi:surfactin synthase thioesterase subunit